MNLDVLGQLQTLQEKLTTASDLLLVRMRQLTAFGAAYSGFFALSSVISLLAVYRLRKRMFIL